MKKRFGQHFLVDEQVLLRIELALDLQAGDSLVEIGPGLGALTKRVLPIVGCMDVVEIDWDLVPRLQQDCARLGELRVHRADALEFDYSQLAHGDHSLRVIGNLPYNISTPLIFHLLSQLQIIRDMHFMLQLEVVNRICAEPGSHAYGRLTVMVQYYCQVEKLFNVSYAAFKPPPKVESAFLRMRPIIDRTIVVNDEAMFSQVVKQAFSQRRKMLSNSLKEMVSAQAFTAASVDPMLRPENLTVQDFVALANVVSSSR